MSFIYHLGFCHVSSISRWEACGFQHLHQRMGPSRHSVKQLITLKLSCFRGFDFQYLQVSNFISLLARQHGTVGSLTSYELLLKSGGTKLLAKNYALLLSTTPEVAAPRVKWEIITNRSLRKIGLLSVLSLSDLLQMWHFGRTATKFYIIGT